MEMPWLFVHELPLNTILVPLLMARQSSCKLIRCLPRLQKKRETYLVMDSAESFYEFRCLEQVMKRTNLFSIITLLALTSKPSVFRPKDGVKEINLKVLHSPIYTGCKSIALMIWDISLSWKLLDCRRE